jgi:hypothetical protein
MALTDIQRASITRQLTPYCAPHPRPEVRAQLRYGFAFESSAVVLFEERPRYDRPQEWMRQDVAKFRWLQSRREWHLYCQFRDLKWRRYEPLPTAKRFETLLAEVEADPTCIFWG